MDELIEHLNLSLEKLDQISKMNEITITICNLIEVAVRNQADTLTINTNHVAWEKDGLLINKFDITRVEQMYKEGRASMSFREALNLIIQTDDVVRQHLQVIYQTQETITCRITL